MPPEYCTIETYEADLSRHISSDATSITTSSPTEPCAHFVNACTQNSTPSNPYHLSTCPSCVKTTLSSQVESTLNPISYDGQTPTSETAAKATSMSDLIVVNLLIGQVSNMAKEINLAMEESLC